VTVNVVGDAKFHVVSYYTEFDVRSRRLKRPSDIMAYDLPLHMFDLSKFRHPPKVEQGLDGRLRMSSEW
jgi:hypothetical protein